MRTPTWWNNSRRRTWRRNAKKWLCVVLWRNSGRQAGLFKLAGHQCGGRCRHAHVACSWCPAKAAMAKRCCWRIWCMSRRQGARQALRLHWIPAEATMTWMMLMRGETDSLKWRSDPREGRSFSWIHGRSPLHFRMRMRSATHPPILVWPSTHAPLRTTWWGYATGVHALRPHAMIEHAWSLVALRRKITLSSQWS